MSRKRSGRKDGESEGSWKERCRGTLNASARAGASEGSHNDYIHFKDQHHRHWDEVVRKLLSRRDNEVMNSVRDTWQELRVYVR
jgi:hypothetical protein